MITNETRNLIALLVLILFFSFGCKEKNNNEIDYCKMLELDQSFVNSDTSDMVALSSDRQKRNTIFKSNFREIIQYSKRNGFPEMGSLKATGLDSCRNWAVMTTLFHVGQSQPKLFFEKNTMNLLKREIENGRLRSGSLFPPLREGFENHTFCKSKKNDILIALNLWGIKIDKLPKIQFVECGEKTN